LPSDKKGGSWVPVLVIKKFKGYYFVNINENPEWLLRVIKQESNGDLFYMTMDEGVSFKEFLDKVSKDIKIDFCLRSLVKSVIRSIPPEAISTTYRKRVLSKDAGNEKN
jgi:hypothetical protein